MNANKKIVNYTDKNTFVVLVPVYYEFEHGPAWKKVFVGTLEECEKEFCLYPDRMRASYEQNKKNRENKKAEYLFLLSIGKVAKAEAIQKQYHF